MAIGAAAGLAGAGIASSIIGGNKSSKMQKAALSQYQGQIEAAVRELEAVGIPSIEVQKIILQKPELVGLEEIPEEIRSEWASMSADPELKAAQADSLEALQGISKTGMTAEDELSRVLAKREVGAQAQARDKAILSQLAREGKLDGGARLAMSASGGQRSADQARMFALDRMAQAESRKMQALQGAGNLAGQMRGQDYQEGSGKASALDSFNQALRSEKIGINARNLANRQNISNERVNVANAQEQHNKGLIQQDYANRMNKAQAVSNARTGGASNVLAGQSNLAAQKGQMYGQIGQGLIGVGGSALKYGMNDPKKAADGGVDFNSSGEGEIIQTGGPAAGDNINAQVNDEEMVLNLPMQEKLNQMLMEYKALKYPEDRIDENVQNGNIDVDNNQQENILAALRGEIPLEEYGEGQVIADSQTGELPPQMSGDVNSMNSIAENGMAFKDGGRVSNDDKYARGISEEYDRAMADAEKLKEAQARTNKKLKAMEELLGITEKKKADKEREKNRKY